MEILRLKTTELVKVAFVLQTDYRQTSVANRASFQMNAVVEVHQTFLLLVQRHLKIQTLVAVVH